MTNVKQKTAAGMVAFLMAFSLLAASSCEAPPPAKAARDYAPLIAQIAQPLPLPTNPDPWAGMSDQERLRGDAEIPRQGE